MVEDVDSEATDLKHIKALYPLGIAPGIVHILAPSAIHIIMEQLGFRETLGGLLQLVYFSGLLVGTLSITYLMQRLTVKEILVTEVFILAASLLAAAWAPWYGLLLVFFFITGSANGIIITLPGVYITQTCGEKSPTVQSMLYGFFSLGIVVGPVLPAMIARWDLSYRWALIVPATIVIPFAVPMMITKFKHIAGVEKLSVKVLKDILSFNRSLFLGLVLGLMLYAAAQGSVNTWLVRFLEGVKGLAPGSAHWVLIAAAVAVTFGRWGCSYLSQKFRPIDMLSYMSVVAAVLVFIAPLPSGPTGSIVLYPLIGLFYSGIYPFLVGYSAQFPTAESSAVFTSIVAAGAIGGAIFPYAIGLMNQHVSPTVGMSLVGVLVIGLIGCIYWVKPHIAEAS